MLKSLNQRGFAPILIIILILLAGLALGVYLVQQRTNIFPKASVSDPIGPETSLSLSGNTATLVAGMDTTIHILVRSDIEAANIFSAQISYPANLLEIVSSNSSVNDSTYIPIEEDDWLEEYIDNNNGKASFIGGLPDPGYRTSPTTGSVKLISLTFRAKGTGSGEITLDGTSAIYSNSTSENILTTTRNIAIAINPFVAASAAPTSSEQISLTVSPTSVIQGQNISFTWSGVQSPSVNDYIEAYANNSLVLKLYTSSCDSTPGTVVRSSGTCTIAAPATAGSVHAALIKNGFVIASADFSITAPSPSASSAIKLAVKDFWPSIAIKPGGTNLVMRLENTSGSIGIFDFVGSPTSYGPGIDWSPSGGSIGVNQTIEINVKAANDVKPGVYKGTVDLRDGKSGKFTSPFEVTVIAPLPSPSAIALLGDGNNNSRIDLGDMSVLYRYFNKTSFPPAIDMNQDKTINNFDRSLLINLLVEKKILRR